MARQQPSTRPRSSEGASETARDRAVVVLGCRLAWKDGALVGAAARRVRAGVEAIGRERSAVVVASGGRVWNDVVEADGMRAELCRLGVPEARVVSERCSHTTLENARFTAALLARRGVKDVTVVTCDWHAARAGRLFRRFGLGVDVAAAASPPRRWFSRAWLFGRERVAERIDGLMMRRSPR